MYIRSREEHRMQAQRKVKHIKVAKEKENDVTKDDEEPTKVPPSIAVLFSAHQFLGRKITLNHYYLLY